MLNYVAVYGSQLEYVYVEFRKIESFLERAHRETERDQPH